MNVEMTVREDLWEDVTQNLPDNEVESMVLGVRDVPTEGWHVLLNDKGAEFARQHNLQHTAADDYVE